QADPGVHQARPLGRQRGTRRPGMTPDRTRFGVFPRVATRSPVFRFFSVDEPSTGDLTYFTSTTRPSHRTSRQTPGPWCRGVTDEHQSGLRRGLEQAELIAFGVGQDM